MVRRTREGSGRARNFVADKNQAQLYAGNYETQGTIVADFLCSDNPLPTPNFPYKYYTCSWSPQGMSSLTWYNHAWTTTDCTGSSGLPKDNSACVAGVRSTGEGSGSAYNFVADKNQAQLYSGNYEVQDTIVADYLCNFPIATPTPLPTSTPTPSPTVPPGTLAPLRYAVMDSVNGTIQFCDSDYYPIGSAGREQQNADAYVANPTDKLEFDTILNRLGLSNLSVFSGDQKLRIYREHKRLNVIFMQSQAGGSFSFSIKVQYNSTTAPQGVGPGTYLVKGAISQAFAVSVASRDSAVLVCPICLSAGTKIDTPSGPILVQNIKSGDLVFTQDAIGAKVASPVVQIASRPTQPGQKIVHLMLQDGRAVWISANHPLADGRLAGALKAGDVVDGSRVVRLEVTPYDASATYDLLPDSAKGTYWANGILVGSTLKG